MNQPEDRGRIVWFGLTIKDIFGMILPAKATTNLFVSGKYFINMFNVFFHCLYESTGSHFVNQILMG